MNQIESLAKKYTIFPSFQALLDAENYRPSLYALGKRSIEAQEKGTLADAYDNAQAARNDPRRAFRG